MAEQFNMKMGAVRIYPGGGFCEENIWRHRGSSLDIPPERWDNISASKYVRKTKYLGRIVQTSLDEVVRSGILPSNETVLIIVHMVRTLGETKTDAIDQQVQVTKAAREKEIPIYVADRGEAPDSKLLPKDIPTTLTAALEEATKGYQNLRYYTGLLGNALHGKDCASGTLMRDDLVKQSVRMAIVIGQSYGQCVDSTILGNRVGTTGPYYQGLLDVGISVVTARAVLDPPEGSEKGSLYFMFDMKADIQLSLPAASRQAGKAQADVLGFPAHAPIDAATNTDAALTHAGIHPTP
jgi:hypothetical protein